MTQEEYEDILHLTLENKSLKYTVEQQNVTINNLLKDKENIKTAYNNLANTLTENPNMFNTSNAVLSSWWQGWQLLNNI